jgi:hypothetical protein
MKGISFYFCSKTHKVQCHVFECFIKWPNTSGMQPVENLRFHFRIHLKNPVFCYRDSQLNWAVTESLFSVYIM